MKAFVLCGGKGTRLRPYTYTVPKPMLPLGRKPILQYVVENLRRNGIKDIVFTVGYKKEQIIDYFGDGKKFGVNLEYSIEHEPMNTAGSILNYKGKIDGSFFVVMGDHLTDIDLKNMMESHQNSGAIATVALAKHEQALEYGLVDMKDNWIVGFREKPTFEFYINAGIYLFEPEILKYIGEKEDFAKDVFPRLLKKNEKINGFVFDEYWVDVGRVSDYEKLNDFINILTVVRNLDYKD